MRDDSTIRISVVLFWFDTDGPARGWSTNVVCEDGPTAMKPGRPTKEAAVKEAKRAVDEMASAAPKGCRVRARLTEVSRERAKELFDMDPPKMADAVFNGKSTPLS